MVEVALEERWLAASGLQPAGVIGLSGPYDFYPFDKPSSGGSFCRGGRQPAGQPRPRRAPPMLLIHGEDDALVKPPSRALAAAWAMPERRWRRNSIRLRSCPLISLASPWRRSRDVDDAMIAFARKVTTVSVPVQQATD